MTDTPLGVIHERLLFHATHAAGRPSVPIHPDLLRAAASEIAHCRAEIATAGLVCRVSWPSAGSPCAARQHRTTVAAIAAAVEIASLRKLLAECADDLAEEINARYPETTRGVYPNVAHNFDRDMEPVRRARALLRQRP